MRLFLLLAAGLAVAGQPLPFEKALDRYNIGAAEFSPDGRRLVFAVTEPVKGATRNSHLWIYTPASKELRQLTYSAKSETSPRWSPDGSALAFTSNREEGNQIYLLAMNGGGGEARPLTKGKASVQAFAWAADGKQIAYLASQPKSEEQEKKEKDKDDARLIDHESKPPQLWIASVDGATAPARPVALGDWTLRQFGWNSLAGRFYGLATRKPHSDRWDDALVSIDAAGGGVREIVKLKGPSGGLELSPDGKRIAFLCARVDGPDPHDLCVADAETGAIRNVSNKVDRAVMGFKWRSASDLLVAVQDGFVNQALRIDLEGNAKPVLKGNASSYVLHASGSAAYMESSAVAPPELWYAASAGKPEKITDFHASWAAQAGVQLETLRYKSFDGAMIEGGLLRPKNEGGGPLPLVVLVHGGPTGRWQDQFEPWGQLLVSRGYAVFYPNPRGSTGYGFDFVAANRADWGFGDFKDVMAGVDYLIAQKVADAKRLGIGGWSYGGYMSMWAVTQTNRFQCAVAGAGLSDLASEFGTENGPAYDEWFFGTPYENLEKFQRSSPITYVKNAKTPTLILQGDADTTDPIGQSQQFYRALKLLGVPSDFVVYPREGHGIREDKHVLDLYKRMVAWYEKYLPKTPAGP